MKRTLAIASFVLLLAGLVLAHGNEQHVMGTITAIGADTITVQTTEKQTKVVYLDVKTKFTKSGAAVNRDDLKVGDRVVIHAQKQGEKLTAHTVAVGISKAATAHEHSGHTHSKADQKQ